MLALGEAPLLDDLVAFQDVKYSTPGDAITIVAHDENSHRVDSMAGKARGVTQRWPADNSLAKANSAIRDGW